MLIIAPQVSQQCTPGGLFIGIVTCDHYNIHNAPHSPTLTCHRTVMGSLRSFEIYKYFCAPQIGMRHVSSVPGHLVLGLWRVDDPRCQPSSSREHLCRSPPPGTSQGSAPLLVHPCKRCLGVLRMLSRMKSHQKSMHEGELRLWNLHGLQPASPIVAPHRRGSIPMSQSYYICEEIPPKSVTLALWDQNFV
jgi:hypothetical protein